MKYRKYFRKIFSFIGFIKPSKKRGKLGPTSERLEVANLLINLHKPTMNQDKEVVASELSKLPLKVLHKMILCGARGVVTRNSVISYRPDLKGLQPRGYDEGDTWDDVPGCAQGREFVVATRLNWRFQPYVPRFGEDHGSYNLAMHEALHSYDYSDDQSYSEEDDFIIAREADYKYLKDYHKQNGEAGRKETFAEIGANVLGLNPRAKYLWPHLYKYFWDNHC